MNPQQLATLQSYGLGAYASRAYLALLGLGRADARETSRLARVPLGKIYRVLDQLADKGLVRVHPTSPKEYAPVPFEEWLDHLRSLHEDRIRELDAKKREHGDLFPMQAASSPDDRGRVRLVKGRRNVVEKLRAHARSSKRDMLILASENMETRERSLLGVWEEASARGVRLRAFVRPARRDAFARLRQLGELRDRSVVKDCAGNVAIAVFDGERAMMVQFVPDDGSLTHGEDVGILTDLPGFARTIQALLEPCWAHAPRL